MRDKSFFAVENSYEQEVTERFKSLDLKEHLDNVDDQRFVETAKEAFGDGTLKRSRVCQGDIRFRKLRTTLDTIMNHLGRKRTEHQIRLHDAYTLAALPIIYGREWAAESTRVLKEFGIKKLKQMVLAITPRRWGKVALQSQQTG